MENAFLYEGANSMQRRDAEEILSEIIGDITIRPGSRVIDIGCGVGDVTIDIIRPRLPKDIGCLVGVDVSSSMIEHARKSRLGTFIQVDIEQDNILKCLHNYFSNNNYSLEDEMQTLTINPKRKHGRIEILVNGETFTDKEEDFRFDVAFSFYCFHWIQNQRKIIQNLFELMKNEAEALIVLLVDSPIFSLYEYMHNSWSDYMKDYKSFISPYYALENPVKVFSNYALESGFVVHTMKCVKKTYTYDNLLLLKDAIKAVNPFLSRVPEALREKFIASCLDTIEKRKLTEVMNGSHRIKYTLLVAHLRKPMTRKKENNEQQG